MTDFSKNILSYRDIEVFAQPSTSPNFRDDVAAGPIFKHIYKLFGPTFSGEYLPTNEMRGHGTYTVSYPGIAFNFPVRSSAYDPLKDLTAILSSPGTLPSSSLAIFSGENWPDARKCLFTAQLEDPKLDSPNIKEKLAYPEEIGMASILGSGTLRLDRAYNGTHFWIQLGQTTPQDIVAELGPPDAIYRKSDQYLSIHKTRANSGNSESTTRSRRNRQSEDRTYESHDDSSSQTGTGSATPTESASGSDSSSEHGESDAGSSPGDETGEDEACFYNYFHHGFDIFISRPGVPSQAPPSASEHTPDSSPETAGSYKTEASSGLEDDITSTSAPLVATKIILHGNIPGTYGFGRHRRVRWRISYLDLSASGSKAICSETPYPAIADALRDEWKDIPATPEEGRQRTKGMVLNRGWGESVGSSVEVLGTWDEGSRMAATLTPDGKGGEARGKNVMGTSMLYGWPGLVFEVGRGGIVGGLTVF